MRAIGVLIVAGIIMASSLAVAWQGALISDPAFREKHLTPRGHEPVANTPDEFARFLAADRATSARIVKEAGVEPQ
jgi:hypothetical protein